MNRCGGPAGATAPGLPFGNPLDLLAEDHWTLRQICSDLDRLATSGPLDPERIGALLGFLGEALADHLADEEEDLFPMLRQKCDIDDEILPTLDRLCIALSKTLQGSSPVAFVQKSQFKIARDYPIISIM